MSEQNQQDPSVNKNDVMEAAMTPPPDVSADQQHFSPTIPHDIESVLSQLVNLSPENILHEPTCLICSSPYRSEIEQKFLETKKYSDVNNVFKNRITISKDVLDNHMRFHHEKGIKELQKVEYINKIGRLNSVELTTLDRIRLALSALTERLTGINSITQDANTSAVETERIKSVETSRLMGSFNQLLKLQAGIMGEMKNSGEVIVIPRVAFISMFNESIANATTDKEKEVIQTILSKLADLSKTTQ